MIGKGDLPGFCSGKEKNAMEIAFCFRAQISCLPATQTIVIVTGSTTQTEKRMFLKEEWPCFLCSLSCKFRHVK